MKSENTQKFSKTISLKSSMYITLSLLNIALLAACIIMNWHAIIKEQNIQKMERKYILSIHLTQLEETMEYVEKYLQNVILSDQDFIAIPYSLSKTDAYGAVASASTKYKPLLKSHNTISAFIAYSSKYDFFHCSWSAQHNSSPLLHEDYLLLKDTVAEQVDASAACWMKLNLSDRCVFLYVFPFQNTIIAAVIDPSLQSFSIQGSENIIAYTHKDGTPMYSITLSGADDFEKEMKEYNTISVPMTKVDGTITYFMPKVSLWNQLNGIQKSFLITTAIGFLTITFVCFIFAHKFMLLPINVLEKALHTIQSNNNSDIRISETSHLLEVNTVAHTLNSMLDTIRQQKIDQYESQLQIQQAQLQYLQLQIRPHFFLNCLNQIYLMAQDKKTEQIPDMVLNLSVYLRSTFKNNMQLVPLKDELKSAESYIHIQQLSMEFPPQLKIDLDADIVEIPVLPLSILSFVENSIKHTRLTNAPLCISIKCKRLCNDESDFLNITIKDNCGGIDADKLKELNNSDTEIYNDKNVGIINIKHRMRLTYGKDATVLFYNKSDGTCVDIFIPLGSNEGGAHYDHSAG